MSETIIAERPATKNDQWRERIAEQARSGMSVRRFCKEQGLAEHSFYRQRKRFLEQGPVRFALVEREPARQELGREMSLELVLPGGGRLRIGSGVESTTLRTVLDALRA